MGEARYDYQTGPGLELQDAALISKMVAGSASPHDAFRKLSAYLDSKNMQLLLGAVLGTWADARPTILFEDDKKTFMSSWKGAGANGLCPVLEKAQALKFPFEALGASYPSRQELSTKRYLVELSRLGHREIGVVPVTIDEMVYLIAVGMRDKQFAGKNRDLIVNVYGQFIAAFAVKFLYSSADKAPVQKMTNEEVKLTAREIALLNYTATGSSLSDLSNLLGISEHTVNIYNDVICKKLRVTNITQALVECIRLGLLDVKDVK